MRVAYGNQNPGDRHKAGYIFTGERYGLVLGVLIERASRT